jgi:hypothetical protein
MSVVWVHPILNNFVTHYTSRARELPTAPLQSAIIDRMDSRQAKFKQMENDKGGISSISYNQTETEGAIINSECHNNKLSY